MQDSRRDGDAPAHQDYHLPYDDEPEADATGDNPSIEAAVRVILSEIGEDPTRDGLLNTPARVARSFAELTAGYHTDPKALINGAIFDVDYDEMVIVRDIHYYSLCVPSKQIVNTVDGAKQAHLVQVGDELWTLSEGHVVPTTVTSITSHKTRNLVEVETSKGVVRVTPDHPFATPYGWVEAKELEGHQVEWTRPRSIHRARYQPQLGYSFGYVVGATASDGTVGDRYLSLIVNDEQFARKYASCLQDAFGVFPSVEPVQRPSSFTGTMVAGHRVRVVSSYLADLFRQYAGGDAHHMRQQLPRVVLQSEECFQGFIDGYVDGDGFHNKRSAGRSVVSANIPLLEEFANLIGARFTPSKTQPASRLYIADSWLRRHGFKAESHRTDLAESQWVEVRRVTPIYADGNKPYTVYSYKCEPHPTFLIAGHLTHNCEHHLLPFYGHAHVAYIPRGKVLGLSKIPRIVEMFARRLQVQERMTVEIADFLNETLAPRGVAVVAQGVHMCSVMRGVRKENASMITSAMRGVFRKDSKTRAEFMGLITGPHHDR